MAYGRSTLCPVNCEFKYEFVKKKGKSKKVKQIKRKNVRAQGIKNSKQNNLQLQQNKRWLNTEPGQLVAENTRFFCSFLQLPEIRARHQRNGSSANTV